MECSDMPIFSGMKMKTNTLHKMQPALSFTELLTNPYWPVHALFPSSQSTYSTEPSRNLNANGIFLPQSCSTRQKKGSTSGVHFGNKFSGADEKEGRRENISGWVKIWISKR